MAEAVKLAISSEFMTAFAALPKQIQGKTTEFISKFRMNPRSPGINYEKLNGAAGQVFYSVRIDQTYRGILSREEETDTYVMLWVDHHDEAYQWADSKCCAVNPTTGVLQLYDTRSIDLNNRTGPRKWGTLFSKISGDQLRQLGVPEDLLSYVRTFSTEEELQAAEGVFPPDTYEYLCWLAEGEPIEDVLDMAWEEQGAEEREKPAETESEALDVPASMRSFVVVEGEEDLRRILAEPLEKWRIFLHPAQRAIVEKEYSGPARVLGGAGTGKTVVALHRARYLASRLEGDGKILFTTFTVNLAEDIQENLKKICTPEELRRIDVVNLDRWVAQYFRQTGYEARIEYDSDILNSVWEEAREQADVDLPYDTDFYREEWNRVVMAEAALTEEQYLNAGREARGTQLDRETRRQVWKVMDCYRKLMKKKGIRDSSWAMYECAQILAPVDCYAHVIVDEGQDFSDNAFRLIRALAGDPHPNDIFIVGDAHQRIYRNHPVLSRCGIDISGRSSTLKINYRTTEETRKYALGLLNGISVDDMDGEEDSAGECQSLTHGEKPVVRNFDDAEEEFDFILKEIQKLHSAGTDYRDICVAARRNMLVEEYMDRFAGAGVPCYSLQKTRKDDRNVDGVRVATMHRVKGLEFPYMFVAAVNQEIVPLEEEIDHTDEASEQEGRNSERCLLYVAVTRAQKAAYITSYGNQSEFLTEM